MNHSPPDIGPFTGVTRCEAVDHGVQGQYTLVLYGAAIVGRQTDPTNNGVAVLLEPRGHIGGAVVVDKLYVALSTDDLPTPQQTKYFTELLGASWDVFRHHVNRSGNTRFKL